MKKWHLEVLLLHLTDPIPSWMVPLFYKKYFGVPKYYHVKFVYDLDLSQPALVILFIVIYLLCSELLCERWCSEIEVLQNTR